MSAPYAFPAESHFRLCASIRLSPQFRQETVFMQSRTLGANRLQVSCLGLGCMGMSEFYGARDDQESLAPIDRALHAAINFLVPEDVYGARSNEELVGKAIRGRRDH